MDLFRDRCVFYLLLAVTMMLTVNQHGRDDIRTDTTSRAGSHHDTMQKPYSYYTEPRDMTSTHDDWHSMTQDSDRVAHDTHKTRALDHYTPLNDWSSRGS